MFLKEPKGIVCEELKLSRR